MNLSSGVDFGLHKELTLFIEIVIVIILTPLILSAGCASIYKNAPLLCDDEKLGPISNLTIFQKVTPTSQPHALITLCYSSLLESLQNILKV